jgi:hypothetical protein
LEKSGPVPGDDHHDHDTKEDDAHPEQKDEAHPKDGGPAAEGRVYAVISGLKKDRGEDKTTRERRGAAQEKISCAMEEGLPEIIDASKRGEPILEANIHIEEKFQCRFSHRSPIPRALCRRSHLDSL